METGPSHTQNALEFCEGQGCLNGHSQEQI